MHNLGQIRRFLELCDLEIWRMTFKKNRAPLLSIIKLYVSFHYHMCTQTGVTVRKRLCWVVTSVTLTFDPWPWPFAWTLLLSLVITPENFMMIRWWKHSQKGVTDGRTDGQTENTICRAAWSQLKNVRRRWKVLCTHTHTHIYIYIYIVPCATIQDFARLSYNSKITVSIQSIVEHAMILELSLKWPCITITRKMILIDC